MKKLSISLLLVLFFVGCVTQKKEIPLWYIQPTQNDRANLYGVAEGFTLNEATKSALVDAASRLMTTVSSSSQLIREEGSFGFHEDMHQKIEQNIDKINFVNFKVSKSNRVEGKFYVEVSIDRAGFVDDQMKKLSAAEQEVNTIDNYSKNRDIISRRNALVKINELNRDLELSARILNGAGMNVDLESRMAKISEFKVLLSLFSDRIEAYFDPESPKEISEIIRNALNKEEIKIVHKRDPRNGNQIAIKITIGKKSSEIYGAYMTKLSIDFANIVGSKVVAGNQIEVSGSSSISKKESYAATLKSLEEEIKKKGVMKVLGLE